MSTLVERLEREAQYATGHTVRDLLREAAAALRATGEGGGERLKAAYMEGWCEAADWAERDDLCADIHSPAYVRARDRRLGRFGRAAAAPTPAERTALVDVKCVKCVKCGQSTMHVGNVCYACSHPTPAEPLRDAGAVEVAREIRGFYDACEVPNDDTLKSWCDRLYALAPAQVDEARVLAVLGHEPQVSDSCTARVIPTPSDKPGPRDPPIWCHLKAGHDGPHRCNHGGGYPSFPFRKSDPVEFREPVTICAKCRTRWPCSEAEKVSAALTAAAKEGK